MAEPTVICINVAKAKRVPYGSLKRSAIDKRPVEGDIFASTLGLIGDEQADLKHHGGPDQAVYAFAREELDAWGTQLGRELASGCFGENLTTQDLDVDSAVVGERWEIGDALFEVTGPRIPCSVFEGFIGVEHWVKRFIERGRSGAYLRVLREGSLKARLPVHVMHRPAHGLTVSEAFAARSGDASLVPKLLQAPELAANLKAWAAKQAAR